MSTLVHLIYIHGFQGNDTSFQSFPKDLQEHLSSRIPSHLDIRIQSSLYPTYKCIKTLSYATNNFLEWLTTQPPGPVILLAHSMGGLLAAEAATHQSNRGNNSKARRIIGVVAFDTPYLGMHPHVVISGIASLLPKGDEDSKKDKEKLTNRAMNDHPQVKIVDEKVTDDWEEFKKQAGRSPYFDSSTLSPQSNSGVDNNSHKLPPRPHSHSPLVDGTLNLLASYSDAALVRWLRKHSDEPLAASRRWIVERYQFGIAMFDPPGLMARYKLLVGWNGGTWVNYWTESGPKSKDNGTQHGNGSEDSETMVSESRRSSISSTSWMDSDTALITTGIVTPVGNSSSETAVKSPKTTPSPTKYPDFQSQVYREVKERPWTKYLKKTDTKGDKLGKRGHHFVVLPHGIGERFGGMDKWERVEIGGVEDEVNAHLGLFMPASNLDYEGLVNRVGEKVLGWCEGVANVA